jgi:hypothetical protein
LIKIKIHGTILAEAKAVQVSQRHKMKETFSLIPGGIQPRITPPFP